MRGCGKGEVDSGVSHPREQQQLFCYIIPVQIQRETA